jgi:hypothetical protein
LHGLQSDSNVGLFCWVLGAGAAATQNQSGMVLQGSASKMKRKAQQQLDGESVAEDGAAMALG